MVSVYLEGPELQPAPVPPTPTPVLVHRNTDVLQLTEVAIFSCSHRVSPIRLLLRLFTAGRANEGAYALFDTVYVL